MHELRWAIATSKMVVGIENGTISGTMLGWQELAFFRTLHLAGLGFKAFLKGLMLLRGVSAFCRESTISTHGIYTCSYMSPRSKFQINPKP